MFLTLIVKLSFFAVITTHNKKVENYIVVMSNKVYSAIEKTRTVLQFSSFTIVQCAWTVGSIRQLLVSGWNNSVWSGIDPTCLATLSWVANNSRIIMPFRVKKQGWIVPSECKK